MFVVLHSNLSLEQQVLSGSLAEIRSIKLRKFKQDTIPQQPTSAPIRKESAKVEEEGIFKLKIPMLT